MARLSYSLGPNTGRIRHQRSLIPATRGITDSGRLRTRADCSCTQRRGGVSKQLKAGSATRQTAKPHTPLLLYWVKVSLTPLLPQPLPCGITPKLVIPHPKPLVVTLMLKTKIRVDAFHPSIMNRPLQEQQQQKGREETGRGSPHLQGTTSNLRPE